ncbi:hypothetical protein ARTHRO9AX_190088 [Arthrobacter sp. 9AX]|nr:hypothetical protein ARTHRO9AX_190088 [Arthrobacter sp. 9AX]
MTALAPESDVSPAHCPPNWAGEGILTTVTHLSLPGYGILNSCAFIYGI